MSASYHSQPIGASSSAHNIPSSSHTPTTRPERRRRHRPRCGQCGSRHFRRNASTGTLVCREGHVLQGYREEEVHDDMDFQQLGYRRQEKKGGRKKKEKERVEVWKGSRARFLTFECLQLILRLQLKALRVEWPHLPLEIEAIARDLWAMYVSTCEDLDATPYNENLDFVTEQIRTAREEEEEEMQGRRAGRAARRANRRRDRAIEEEKERLSQSQRQETEEEEEMRDLERRMEADMRGQTADQDPPDQPRTSQAKRQGTSSPPQWRRFRPLVHLSSMLYLTLVAARIPLLWSDIRDLYLSSRIPYLSAFLLLPPAMTDKLPASQLAKLEETTIPSVPTLQECTGLLAGDLTHRYGIQFPELNAAPVVWRCVRGMGLPPGFYQLALSILTYLGVPLAVVPKQAVSDPWSYLNNDAGQGPDEGESTTAQLPPLTARLNITTRAPVAGRCTIIMAAVIVAAKMVYGLDGLPRSLVKSSGAPPCTPPLSKWLSSLAHASSLRLASPHLAHELHVPPSSLDEDGLDALIGFAEQSFLQRTQPNIRRTTRKEEMRDLFPSERLGEGSMPHFLPPFSMVAEEGSRKSLWEVREEMADRLNEEIYEHSRGGFDEAEDAAAQLGSPNQGASPSLLPGEDYAVQSSSDQQGVLHPSFQAVLDHAASIVGLASTCTAVTGKVHDDGQGIQSDSKRVAGEAREDEMAIIVGDIERLLLRRMTVKRDRRGDRARRAAATAGGEVGQG